MVAPRRYVPSRGDVVWLHFTPQAGHEHAGHRPALVVSPRTYNEKVGLALFCPITSQVKGYPFEVALESGGKAKGVVLSDQLKSLDWRARDVRKFDSVTDTVMTEVLVKIAALIGWSEVR